MILGLFSDLRRELWSVIDLWSVSGDRLSVIGDRWSVISLLSQTTEYLQDLAALYVYEISNQKSKLTNLKSISDSGVILWLEAWIVIGDWFVICDRWLVIYDFRIWYEDNGTICWSVVKYTNLSAAPL